MKPEEKQKRINEIRELINSPLSASSAYAGLNMCDIYLNIQDRNYVLSTLQERFPHATGDLQNAEEWADKLASLKSNKAYISGFAGQVGEEKAMETLNNMGYKTKFFKSLTNKDNDLESIDGGPDWSVKSYKDLNNFKQIIKEHPSSDHYVINSELFEELKISGELEAYSNKGITIIDGNFSHTENVELATERLNSITGDISDEIGDGLMDDIPIVAGIVTLANIGINIHKYYEGRATKEEAYKDVIRGIGKISAATGGAAAGTAIGASIGSAIFPLAGTLIGGGVGAFIGSMGVREIVDNIAMKWKWGNSLAAYKYFSSKYQSEWDSIIKRNILNKFYLYNSVKDNLSIEKKRFDNYAKQLDLGDSENPTIMAVIIHETIKRLKRTLVIAQNASENIQEELMNVCIESGLSKFPRERDKSKYFAELMYGAIIAENSNWLIRPNPKEKELFEKMCDELKKAPNNPFKFKQSKEEIFKAIAISTLSKQGEKKHE
ncbi:MAG: hypothetical protein SCALA702_01340 [Melioribacteraceae bacterium]|nr:MAG: hypothetical protein SCALA702_01340 [Melioribacteraceae bacterium]